MYPLTCARNENMKKAYLIAFPEALAKQDEKTGAQGIIVLTGNIGIDVCTKASLENVNAPISELKMVQSASLLWNQVKNKMTTGMITFCIV